MFLIFDKILVFSVPFILGCFASVLYLKVRKKLRLKKLKVKRLEQIKLLAEITSQKIDSTLIQNKEEINFIKFNYNLTEREQEITNGIVSGFTYKELGESLYISESTVSKHASNIFKKTNCKNKKELIEIIKTSTLNIQDFQN
jgi:DNA-binding NarL/FixJ family response regulator